jgi:hypothetical protein
MLRAGVFGAIIFRGQLPFCAQRAVPPRARVASGGRLFEESETQHKELGQRQEIGLRGDLVIGVLWGVARPLAYGSIASVGFCNRVRAQSDRNRQRCHLDRLHHSLLARVKIVALISTEITYRPVLFTRADRVSHWAVLTVPWPAPANKHAFPVI